VAAQSTQKWVGSMSIRVVGAFPTCIGEGGRVCYLGKPARIVQVAPSQRGRDDLVGSRHLILPGNCAYCYVARKQFILRDGLRLRGLE